MPLKVHWSHTSELSTNCQNGIHIIRSALLAWLYSITQGIFFCQRNVPPRVANLEEHTPRQHTTATLPKKQLLVIVEEKGTSVYISVIMEFECGLLADPPLKSSPTKHLTQTNTSYWTKLPHKWQWERLCSQWAYRVSSFNQRAERFTCATTCPTNCPTNRTKSFFKVESLQKCMRGKYAPTYRRQSIIMPEIVTTNDLANSMKHASWCSERQVI